MSELLTLELPDQLARQARALAAATNRPVEEAIVEWIEKAVAEAEVQSLPDDQLLALLCDAMLTENAQEQLSELLGRQREGTITDVERSQLYHLLDAYRRRLVLKARAWKEAGARGLKPRLRSAPGSSSSVLAALEKSPQVAAEGVDELEQLIALGRRPPARPNLSAEESGSEEC
jgi:hypothetical protein